MQTYGANDPASKKACRAQDNEKVRILGSVAAFVGVTVRAVVGHILKRHIKSLAPALLPSMWLRRRLLVS